MTAKLEVSGLSYSYHSMDGETQALSNISFTVDTGEFIAIVGPSGCGKSTLLSIFSGLLKPDEGEILIDGIPLPDSKVNIGYMLQKDHLFEWRSILSNAALGLEIQHKIFLHWIIRHAYPYAMISAQSSEAAIKLPF